MEQAATPLAADVPASDTLCPRCQKPLVDPRGLGWCQGCGYCRSLDEDRSRLPLTPAAPASRTSAPRVAAAVQVPRWAIVLLAGVFSTALASWIVGRYVQLEPLHRAVWATVQAAVGLLIMFAGQACALVRIAPEEATLHFVDAIVPFRLYGLVCKRLPRMAIVLCVGSWGLALTVSGLLFIGGMSHWLNYLPKSQDAQQTQSPVKAPRRK